MHTFLFILIYYLLYRNLICWFNKSKKGERRFPLKRVGIMREKKRV